MDRPGLDKRDVIALDVPLFIRLLEQCREDVKSDADLHRLVSRVLDASKQHDVLTMDNYAEVTLAKVLSRLG